MDIRKNEKICIKQLDIFFLRFSILMQIINMCFDYNIAIRYLLNSKITSFILTICFILIPSLITVLVNRRMQKQDKEKNPVATRDDCCKRLNLIIKKTLFFMIAVPLKLVLIVYYWETSKDALRVHKCKKAGDDAGEKWNYSKMLRKYQDIVFLRILECYLETAPQQILQLTLILMSYKSDNENNLEFYQTASVVSSFVSMGLAMAGYHRSIQLIQENKLNIDIMEIILQFLWPFCITGIIIIIVVARILSLSVIASIWPTYVICCCITYWIAMTIGILSDFRGILEFCQIYNLSPHMTPSIKERIYSVLFASIIGLVHIFIYLNTTNSEAFFKYRCFYFLSFFENFISSFSWIINCPPSARELYFRTLLIIYIVSFFLGLMAIFLYYFCNTVYSKKLNISPNIRLIQIPVNTKINTQVTEL